MSLPSYVPILKAMNSEAAALMHAGSTELEGIIPLFEITKLNPQLQEAARFRGVTDLTRAYLDEVTERISSVWKGGLAMVDNFPWDPIASTGSGEHILEYTINKLLWLDVNVIPVIGYDRWHVPEYKLAMQNLEVPNAPYYCLRLESVMALGADIDDASFFKGNIETILADLKLDASNCVVMLDFGDASRHDLKDMNTKVDKALRLLKPYGFKFFITTACSMPPSINLAVDEENTAGKVQRKEMLLWKNQYISNPSLNVVYGDYGVRGPNSNEGSITPDANGKIRYTIENHFYVVRGHSMRKGIKGEQMWALAKHLVGSAHYRGPEYSWGDECIALCAEEKIKGGHAQWISYDTSHHLNFVLEEVYDFVLMSKTKPN